MRLLRYSVAASLDGCIAGPTGEFDWIPMDPDIEFAAMYAAFGAIVMGRRSYEAAAGVGGVSGFGLPVYVYSRTLPEGPVAGATVVREAVPHVRELKAQAGRDVWLWGGGELYRTLASEGLVDGVTIALVPVVLGGGIRLVPSPGPRSTLHLRSHRVYPKTGTVLLDYDVVRG
jgi:dihydrofolate reductase